MYLKRNSKINSAWSDGFLGLIKKTAQRLEKFTASDVRQTYFRSKLGTPPKPTCIAPCFRRAIKMRMMKRTGEFRKADSGVYEPVYVSLVFKEKRENK